MTEVATYCGHIVEEFGAVCGQSEVSYRWTGHRWDLVPSRCRKSSVLWSVWDQLQVNGLVSYREDPNHNLAISEYPDCQDFGNFCRFDGRVLDVGCGPKPWPAYFCGQSARTRFVGVDLLIEDSCAQYVQHRAVVEYLPFRPAIFGHVLFAASSTK
jgi:hypothetical protein